MVPAPQIDDAQVEELLDNALKYLLASEERVRASVLKQQMSDASKGSFDKSMYAEGSFRKFLEKYPHLVKVEQVETTIYAPVLKSKTKPPCLCIFAIGES